MYLTREDAICVIQLAEQIAEHGWLDEQEQNLVFRISAEYGLPINKQFFGGQDENNT